MLIMSTLIEPTFGYLLNDISRLLRKQFDQRAREVGLSLAQGRTLVYLALNQGINQAGLADILEVRPISLARLLDRMETAGWIERRPDPADRRVHRLHLADKAHPVLETVQALATELRSRAMVGLSDYERSQLMLLLRRVRENLGDPRHSRGENR